MQRSFDELNKIKFDLLYFALLIVLVDTHARI